MGESYKTDNDIMAVEKDNGVVHRFMLLPDDGIVVLPPDLWTDSEVRDALDENDEVTSVRNHKFVVYRTS